MKITIIDKQPNEEDEIIVKCNALDENITKLLNSFKVGKEKMICYNDTNIVPVDPKDILYFESVDDRVFVYTSNSVYESKSRLYQLEKELPARDFMRANKAMIVNLNKVESLSPAFGGRFEAVLKNGYKVIISRMYVNTLKETLGI